MTRFRSLAAALVVGLACLLAAAGWTSAARAADPATPVSAAGSVNPVADYRLGAGDKIRVITFGEDSLTGEFYVGGSGKVSLPLIGEVQAAGVSVPDFQRSVETALKNGFLQDPKVSVEVLNYRPFYILGEVQKPGEYPYTNALTVQNAVATANGFTYRANTKKVFIKRANSDKEVEYPLTSNTAVAPGDTIRIAERFF
jgi:protein involved in polysaccharide export with SLBB domain